MSTATRRARALCASALMILAVFTITGCEGDTTNIYNVPTPQAEEGVDCTDLSKVQVYTAQPAVAARGATATAASATITLAGVVAGNTVTVGAQDFTAVASNPGSRQFVVGASDPATATSLAAVLNAHSAVSTAVGAVANAAVVTLTAKIAGVSGNYIALKTNSASTVVLSGATLSGGAGSGKGVITVSGSQFRDSSGDGLLQPYEDWRLLEICRARDLVSRMSVAAKVALMSEGSPFGDGTSDGSLTANTISAAASGRRQNLSRFARTAAETATFANHVNELAEALPLGIPVVFLGDPAHYTAVSMTTGGDLVVAPPANWTPWPGTLGLVAARDVDLTFEHGDMVRREFMAAGLRWQLGPMIDLATEPRWYRVYATLGSSAAAARNHTVQLVTGFQGSANGNLRNGIAATAKHFAGHGAQLGGLDAHFDWGRYTAFPGDAFSYHLIPFQAAFDVGVAAIMPNYSVQRELFDVNPLQVPSAFSYELITEVAKQQMGFDGLVTADWFTLAGATLPGFYMGGVGTVTIGGNGYGMEGLTTAERAALFLKAGSHQLGSESASYFADAHDQGLVTEAEIDGAAEKILELSFKLGLFENPYVDATQAAVEVKSAGNRQVGFDAMKKSIVLLANGDHTGANNHYLPITATASRDANGDGRVSVYYDGAVDGLVGNPSRPDGVQDILGNYDYTSPAAPPALAVESVATLAEADVAVIRIVARAGSLFQGAPLSFDGVLPTELLYGQPDNSLAPALASKKKVIDALRVRDGYRLSDGSAVLATNPDLKIVLVCSFVRPPILRPFVSGLVSLDEAAGEPGSYPSVSDEANIRQFGGTYVGGGGVDALLVDFGAYDRAVLDFVFNRNVPAGFTYGSARLPMEIPSSDAAVEAQFPDLADDTLWPTYSNGAGMALPAS